MEKDKLNAYAARVAQANRSELTVIIYEAFLESVKEGRKFLENNDIQACRRETERARGFLTELLGSLDFSYPVSHYLRRIYVYSYRELCQGVALRDSERMEHASHVMEQLLTAFREVAVQDDSQPVMQNAEPIYAGLTYGKNSLNENIGVGVNMNRGFQA